MAEDEANADDPEDDINAYMTWFPRYVYSDESGHVESGRVSLGLVGSDRVRLSQFGYRLDLTRPITIYLQENHGFG